MLHEQPGFVASEARAVGGFYAIKEESERDLGKIASGLLLSRARGSADPARRIGGRGELLCWHSSDLTHGRCRVRSQ
jgi:hypothetical protein